MDVRLCKCGGRLKTIETRDRGYGVYRRRKCDVCGFRVKTMEFVPEYYDEDTEEVVLGKVEYTRYKPWRKDV